MYVTEELRTYHDQITGVTNRNTMVLRLRNVKFFMSPTVYICNSYNMGTRDLPDIYAQARGLQARGRRHIYQENSECPRYN